MSEASQSPSQGNNDALNNLSLDKLSLKNTIEAVLIASNKPLSLEKLHGLFFDYEQPAKSLIKEVLTELEADYKERGVNLVHVASGYRFQTNKAVAPWVSRLWEERPQKYSRALLETLALIAYRQPITRGEIEEVRGVAVSSNIIKTLLERQWVKVVGHKEVPGRPAIYGTTKLFLDYFGLQGLDKLPPLSEMRDIDAIAREVSEQLELNVDEGDGIANESEQTKPDHDAL